VKTLFLITVIFFAVCGAFRYRQLTHGTHGGAGSSGSSSHHLAAYRDISTADLRAQLIFNEAFLAQCKDAIENPQISRPACSANSPITVHVSADTRKQIAQAEANVRSLRAELALRR
jgi:hypothetical protein